MTGILHMTVTIMLAIVISKSVKSKYCFKKWKGFTCLITFFIDYGNVKYANNIPEVEITVAKQN